MTTSLRVCAIVSFPEKTDVYLNTMPFVFIAQHGGSSDSVLGRIFVFHCANCWFEHWRARSLSDSQQSYNSDVVFMWEQVCSSEEVHCGSVRSTAGDGGTSDTRTTPRLFHSIKREHIDLVSGS